MSKEGKQEPFSKRYGHAPGDREITIWEDAPAGFRHVVLEAAKQECGLTPSMLRDIVCRILRVPPNPQNWSEYPNIWNEVKELASTCEWYRFYDIVETIAQCRRQPSWGERDAFSQEINDCLREMGVGWQLKDNLIQIRGSDTHEELVRTAIEVISSSGLSTAQGEIAEAIRDLSRRPDPDLSGSVHHAMAALECVAREVIQDAKPTLGDLVSRHPEWFPKPLDEIVSKAWGYASENARHGREDRKLDRTDAELIVGLCSVVTTYLLRKRTENNQS